ncbi:MAG: 2-keto-3-deoxy-L-fuconate dehydrogenase [Ilumatobacter sp.]|jgi:2-keto-3-deoxy-L-fuconate dehydrogenase
MKDRQPGTKSWRRRVRLVQSGVVAALQQPAPVSWSVAEPRRSGDFDKQSVVVTGSAGLIGRHLVDAFVAAGAFVHAVDIDEQGLADAQGKRSAADAARVHDHVLDLADLDAVQELATSISTVDVVVNNAGHNDWVADVAEITPESFRRMLDVNVVGPSTLTAGLVKPLAAGGGGAVVFVTSIHSMSSSRFPQYGSAKAALSKLTIDLAAGLAPEGIRVNAVAPGWVADSVGDQNVRWAPRQILGASAIPVEAIGHAVMFLADRYRSPMTTGQELVVDGGALLATPH